MGLNIYGVFQLGFDIFCLISSYIIVCYRAYLFFEVKKVIPNAQRSHFVGSGRDDWYAPLPAYPQNF